MDENQGEKILNEIRNKLESVRKENPIYHEMKTFKSGREYGLVEALKIVEKYK